MVWSGSPAHPSNCTRLWCSKYPRNTRNIFLKKGKVCRPCPHNWKANSPKAFRPIKHCCCHSLISFSCMTIESFHLQQGLPHSARSSSISPIRGIPLNSILLVPSQHLWRSQSLPPTNDRKNKRNGPPAREQIHGMSFRSRTLVSH